MAYGLYYAVFGIGLFLGMAFVLFMQGASHTSKEHEMFTEGYKAGLKESRKETPQKPREDVLGYRCPVCDKPVWGLVSKMQYCGECGNKMDWGDAE